MDPPAEEGQEEHGGLCPHCVTSPCLLLQGLHGSLLEYYEEDLCDGLEGLPIYDNKATRHRLYIRATNWIHGPLGKGIRKKLPECVVTVIQDIAPAEAGQGYVGFKPAPGNNPQESTSSFALKKPSGWGKENNPQPHHSNNEETPEKQPSKRPRVTHDCIYGCPKCLYDPN